uniref:Ufd2P_core domain-containing protein n=1 Tax=Angiostrongylus cantonensis TaxID=6313 RepID=A0A0K0D8D0_ANGCA
LVAHSVQLVMGGPIDGSRRSILPDPVTEDALADSFAHPLFIIFRNLCYTPDTDATTRSLMVNMIATMRDYDNTVTYLMLFFIKVTLMRQRRLKFYKIDTLNTFAIMCKWRTHIGSIVYLIQMSY